MSAVYPEISRSNELWARALGLMPRSGNLLAKAPGQWTEGVAPKFAARADAGHVWDVDGNEYVDLMMAVGPVTLGHRFPAVDEAIRAQLELGINFSLMSPLEVEVAALVKDVVPGVEHVRFSKTGADAVSAAVRLARAFTGRTRVLCCGYHGWHDWYIAVTDRSRGIPSAAAELTHTFEYNDLAGAEAAADDDTAAIVIEPTVFDAPAPGFLQGLRDLCDRRGIVLVFDEMWTGFRLALGGAQAKFDVRADLVCFSKAVANGMPLSVLCGRRDLLAQTERDVFFFTTFAGEALTLAAAKATLETMKHEPVFEALYRRGAALRDGYNRIAFESGADFTSCVGFEPRTLVKFTSRPGASALEMKTFVQQEMIARGILWAGFHNVCYTHTDDDVAAVLAAYREVVPMLAEAVEHGDLARLLRGKVLEPVFRKVSGFNMRPATSR
jgi:glutamate-1-semialdehyde 2,1-aminomutase